MNEKHQYLCLDEGTREYFVTTEKCKDAEDAEQYIGEHVVLRPIIEGNGNIRNPIVCGECQSCKHFMVDTQYSGDEYFGVCLNDDSPTLDVVVPINFGCTYYEPKGGDCVDD